MKLSQYITAVHEELDVIYIGEVMNWADTKYNNAFSLAVERFDLALSKALHDNDFSEVEAAGELYKSTVLGLIREWKEEQSGDQVEMFLGGL